MDFAAVPFDAQPVFAYGREVGAACNESYIRLGSGKRGAVEPTDAAGTDHGDTHLITSARQEFLARAFPLRPDDFAPLLNGTEYVRTRMAIIPNVEAK